MQQEINNLQDQIEQTYPKIMEVISEVHKKVVGQDDLIEWLLIALLAKWHILLEWVPGLAKTLSVDSLSKTMDLWFSRIQFTPDLLPSDLIWTEIFNSKTQEFKTKFWPVFSNFILADEINRAPSKVQSALLEAMAEKQITIWDQTYKLQEPFIVLATQNPLEQSWTYKLPEAQMDRFLLKIDVDYPNKEDELNIYKKFSDGFWETINKVLTRDDIFEIQNIIQSIYVSDKIFDYVYEIIDSTRNPEMYNLEEIKNYIDYWVSPRWWLALISSAKVIAFLNKRTFIVPEDIKQVAENVLSHRLWLTYEAIADEIWVKDIIQKIIEQIKVI